MDLSLEGEDICVCVGLCADADMPRWAGRIALSRATTIVCLHNPNSPDGADIADRFAQTLESNLPSAIATRRILVMGVNEWERLYSAHQGETFSIVHLHIDSSMALPSSAAKAKSHAVSAELSGFDDVALLQELLLKVVEVFAKPSHGGMWPSVLLLGETGSGKTYTARRIYDALVESGAVKDGDGTSRFVSLNCGEFGHEDMNAVLFGVKGGAFTGIPKDRPGAIANAQGGVLFLDEIGTLPMELQPRLLTVLDGGKYRVHGASEATETPSCRFVFGTNEDLARAVKEGRFRFDLYNRISGISVHLPSVKERIDGRHGESFLGSQIDAFCKRHGGLRLTDYARAIFVKFAKQHPWGGNFRELNRCFQVMAMNSDWRNVVSASAMEDVINEIVRTARAENLSSDNGFPSPPDANPLLSGRTGLGANEKVMLSFAFTCAAQAATCQDAGRRFFAGKYASSHNWNSSFSRYLARFGFRWDKESTGHIARCD